jgi:hypothetical protein
MKIMNVKFPVWIIYKKGFYSLFIGNFIHISGTMSLMFLSEQDGIQKGSQRLFLSQMNLLEAVCQ